MAMVSDWRGAGRSAVAALFALPLAGRRRGRVEGREGAARRSPMTEEARDRTSSTQTAAAQSRGCRVSAAPGKVRTDAPDRVFGPFCLFVQVKPHICS